MMFLLYSKYTVQCIRWRSLQCFYLNLIKIIKQERRITFVVTITFINHIVITARYRGLYVT